MFVVWWLCVAVRWDSNFWNCLWVFSWLASIVWKLSFHCGTMFMFVLAISLCSTLITDLCYQAFCEDIDRPARGKSMLERTKSDFQVECYKGCSQAGSCLYWGNKCIHWLLGETIPQGFPLFACYSIILHSGFAQLANFDHYCFSSSFLQDDDECFVDQRGSSDELTDTEEGSQEMQVPDVQESRQQTSASYQPLCRNPLYCHADRTCGWELCSVRVGLHAEQFINLIRILVGVGVYMCPFKSWQLIFYNSG